MHKPLECTLLFWNDCADEWLQEQLSIYTCYGLRIFLHKELLNEILYGQIRFRQRGDTLTMTGCKV